MRLLEYLNKVGDLDALTKSPYNLKIVNDNDFYLFKYNMIESNFSLAEVCDARGSIFTQVDGQWIYVCRPFDKFFNYGEPHAADIDWASARCTEKVDGSIMKMWYYDNRWHLSTNGVINAFEAFTPMGDSFGEIFERILGTPINIFGFSYLDENYTYIFEMTSPETRVVIPYDDGIYFLAARNNKNGNYLYATKPAYYYFPDPIKLPKVFDLTSLDDVLKVTLMMSKDEEGIVVNDKYGNRIKVKSPEYLAAHHMKDNTVLNPRKVIEMIRNASLDDYIAYFNDDPSLTLVNNVLQALASAKEEAMKEWEDVVAQGHLQLTKKQFVFEVFNSDFKNFFLKKFDHPDFTFQQYIDNMHIKKLEALIEKYLN